MQQHGSKYFARRPLPTPTALTLGLGAKGHHSTFFQNMAMLHIKLKKLTNAARW